MSKGLFSMGETPFLNAQQYQIMIFSFIVLWNGGG